jgi:hypothetical protein
MVITLNLNKIMVERLVDFVLGFSANISVLGCLRLD